MMPWDLLKRAIMGVWYRHVGLLNRIWPSIVIEGRRLMVYPGVYKPLENESVCAAYCRPGDRVLDLGCGSGVASVFCSDKAREIVAVDISAAAVENTIANCNRLRIRNVTVLQSDMFSRVGGRFDLILANAPYVAADFADEREQFATSVRYLPVLLAEAPNHLTLNGRLLVQFPIWFAARIKRLAADHGLKVVEIRRLPPKPFMLKMLSLAYLQVGFRSAHFLIEPLSRVEVAEAA